MPTEADALVQMLEGRQTLGWNPRGVPHSWEQLRGAQGLPGLTAFFSCGLCSSSCPDRATPPHKSTFENELGMSTSGFPCGWMVATFEPGANLKSIPHRCHPILVAFVRELTQETVVLPLGCLQRGVQLKLPRSSNCPKQIDLRK